MKMSLFESTSMYDNFDLMIMYIFVLQSYILRILE